MYCHGITANTYRYSHQQKMRLKSTELYCIFRLFERVCGSAVSATIMGTVCRKKTMSPEKGSVTRRCWYNSVYVHTIWPTNQRVQPKASNIQNAFLRPSGLTALISRVPFTKMGIMQSTMFAAEDRASPAGIHRQMAE